MLGFQKNNKVHFIGIGGIGMSGIAEILLDMGYQISGSDITISAITDKLKSKGAAIYTSHDEENLDHVSLVVYSSAIDEENPEIKAARKNKIPVVRRAEMLAELMRLKFGIAIAGSHGKTTTTSLVATILDEAKLDPTHVIGGIVQNLGGHAKMGSGQYLVAEADESDGSFLLLNPIFSIITNIDNDHLDFYKTEKNLVQAFCDFANRVPFYGRVVLNAQDKHTGEILKHIKRPYLLVGSATQIKDKLDFDYSADKIKLQPACTTFDLFKRDQRLGEIKTHLSGEHNVQNTLAAVAIASELGISLETINDGLKKFFGVGRRLEKLYEEGNFSIYDDYGHHPTEIKATIKTLHQIYKKRLCVIFEPHRYTRTKQLWSDFLTSFDGADEIFIGPIYAASEAAIEGINSEKLAQELSKKHSKVKHLPNLDQMKQIILDRKKEDMIVLTMGAGSISKKIKSVISSL
jgi:UDP-N-acetylmuramate--alanine ligase